MKNSIYTVEYQKFLKNLRQARKEAGFTQVEIAKKLSQHQSYISKCESGEKRVDIVELLRFARAYKKPIDYFIKDILEK